MYFRMSGENRTAFRKFRKQMTLAGNLKDIDEKRAAVEKLYKMILSDPEVRRMVYNSQLKDTALDLISDHRKLPNNPDSFVKVMDDLEEYLKGDGKKVKREKMQFTFQGRQEAIDIINSGGEIVSYLSTLSGECPLMKAEVEFVEKLGKGSYGAAFLVKIDGMGNKQYVAKRMVILSEIESNPYGKAKTLRELAEDMHQRTMVSAEAVISVNGGDPDEVIEPDGKFMYLYVPTYAKVCKVTYNMEEKRTDGKGTVKIPKGSYLCENNQYSEYINGVLCGELYRKGISVNFLDVFSFITCPVEGSADDWEKRGSQYVFMEKIDDEIGKYLKTLSRDRVEAELPSIYAQILHAILCYQRTYQLQHNDLHDANVFMEYIKPDAEFNGQQLYDAEWFHYSVDGEDYYFPYTRILAKIGDFGLSVKYSHPIVGDKESATGGYDQEDGYGPWVPNWYTENYDVLTITYRLYWFNMSNKFIGSVLDYILREGKGDMSLLFSSNNLRPRVKKLEDMGSITPKSIFENILGNYRTKPSSGRIVTLGVI
jgi:serine/threonine protein kinase